MTSSDPLLFDHSLNYHPENTDPRYPMNEYCSDEVNNPNVLNLCLNFSVNDYFGSMLESLYNLKHTQFVFQMTRKRFLHRDLDVLENCNWICRFVSQWQNDSIF